MISFAKSKASRQNASVVRHQQASRNTDNVLIHDLSVSDMNVFVLKKNVSFRTLMIYSLFYMYVIVTQFNYVKGERIVNSVCL